MHTGKRALQSADKNLGLVECIQEGYVQDAYRKVGLVECIQVGGVLGAYRKVGLEGCSFADPDPHEIER